MIVAGCRAFSELKLRGIALNPTILCKFECCVDSKYLQN